MSREDLKKPVHAFISWRLDYCCRLLSAQTTVRKLIYSSARVLTRSRRSGRIEFHCILPKATANIGDRRQKRHQQQWKPFISSFNFNGAHYLILVCLIFLVLVSHCPVPDKVVRASQDLYLGQGFNSRRTDHLILAQTKEKWSKSGTANVRAL